MAGTAWRDVRPSAGCSGRTDEDVPSCGDREAGQRFALSGLGERGKAWSVREVPQGCRLGGGGGQDPAPVGSQGEGPGALQDGGVGEQ